nr:Ras-related protein RABA5c-like [Tanacetum cinerariifolium]
MLVGNKCDLDNIRAVSVEDGKNLAEKHRLFFMETSALDLTNVKTAFEMVIKEIYNNDAELEELEKLESMDLVQKSRVKWEVKGDENLKLIHVIIKSRRKSPMVQGIMLDGGLGVGSLKAFNMSFLLKWIWRLFHNPNALWVHVVKAIHGDEAGNDIRGCHTNGVWASIVGLIFHSSGIVPLNSIRIKVGDGSSIRFWKDTTSRPVNVGRTKAEFDAFVFYIASLEPKELVDSDTCIWSLSYDDKVLVNSVRKHIDELSLPSLSPNTRW